MEGVFIEAAKQSPGLVVLVTALIVFLRHLSVRNAQAIERDKAFAATIENRDKALKTIGDQCHEFQRECLKQVQSTQDRTNKALDENTAMLGELRATVQNLNHK